MRVTRKERVLRFMQQRPGAWIDAPMIASPDVGGSEGLRRLRELRMDGWDIQKRPHPDRRRAVRQYRLVMNADSKVIPIRAADPVWVRGHYRGKTQERGEVTSMPDRDYHWEPFNQSYGPWYRLKGERNGLSVNLTSGGHPVEVLVVPDMNRESWFWSVTFAKYTPRQRGAPDPKKVALKEYKISGRAETVDEAKNEAITALKGGRPKNG